MTENTQKIALITGASRGLGAALAEALGRRGWHILAVARTIGALEELDDRIRAAGGTATLAPMDASTPEAMGQLVKAVADRWKGLDLWAHTAIHAAPLAPTPQIDGKDWDKSLSVNVLTTQGLIGLIHPLLLARQGQAMFFADPRAGQSYFGAYGATKAAQIALARSWAAEGARLGPRVTVATPAPMPTATRARFFPGEDRAALTPCATEAERLLTEAGI
ncbi:SDR family NAD(P)-dependent oxidoreductase [Paracoccus pacificus]|uniref:SDR family NAD(P)-dependent oxidoreductase n=1 Tax=Paracoccus pacificus TaxID=1463598 RepID=A0ABW4RB89_9RHOB